MPLPSEISLDELKTQLAFWRVKNVSAQLMQNCLSEYENFQTLFEQKPAHLMPLIQKADWQGAEKDLQWLDQPDHYLLLNTNPLFPKSLCHINQAPPFIFLKGNPTVFEKKILSIVGSRKPSYYGIKAAKNFSYELSKSGLVISSGLALGIDTTAHQGALSAEGETIAVVATGLDQVYPKQNQSLAENIYANHGAIISEFGIGMPPLAENFPRRNRLISGISLGVLIVEATLKSGSLITARLAMEQGREVFAIPGSIFQALSQGNHALIKQGAKCVENIYDILNELLFISENHQGNSGKLVQTKKTVNLSENETILFHLLHELPQSFEELSNQLQWNTEKLQITLTQLLLKEQIQKTPYGYCLAEP